MRRCLVPGLPGPRGQRSCVQKEKPLSRTQHKTCSKWLKARYPRTPQQGWFCLRTQERSLGGKQAWAAGRGREAGRKSRPPLSPGPCLCVPEGVSLSTPQASNTGTLRAAARHGHGCPHCCEGHGQRHTDSVYAGAAQQPALSYPTRSSGPEPSSPGKGTWCFFKCVQRCYLCLILHLRGTTYARHKGSGLGRPSTLQS